MASPWTLRTRIKMQAWEWCWTVFCSWTPKPLSPWRLVWLRLFGCRIEGRPHVHQRSRFHMPWNVVLHDRAVIGDRTNLYAMAMITIGARSVIAQEAYLAAGTHDFSDAELRLVVAPITVGADVFICARAFVLPGLTIGDGALVGACAMVTRDVEPWTVILGNPGRPRGPRAFTSPP